MSTLLIISTSNLLLSICQPYTQSKYLQFEPSLLHSKGSIKWSTAFLPSHYVSSDRLTYLNITKKTWGRVCWSVWSFENKRGEWMNEAGSVSFCFTLRLAFRSILSQCFSFLKWETKLPLIFPMTSSAGKIEAGEVQGTVEGPSDTYLTDM